MSQFLDELARSLAKPMPRSRALRLIGGALVATAVPGVTPRRAAARTLKGCDPKACGKAKVCGIPFLEGCTLACCDKTFPICCKWTGTDLIGRGGEAGLCSAHAAIPGEPARVVCCCPPGTVCNASPRAAPCKKCLTEPCGPHLSQCCKPDEHCSYARKDEGFPTNGLCCPKGRHGCGPNGPGIGRWTHCCPPGKVCCGNEGTGHCCTFVPRPPTPA
jgi:hypothetical protein